ncbi:hypothetical protein FHS83_003183 [Rhizomicrobium palustre]|uniref:Uncharacterized protein n=1 Tax=Rhizomicrobium palustre TaxID=189966 RepID=A0A846N309_9PROT|nr:hypothetical protein [Rhizomicrobium palustre]NIK89865.1 hypothetical protein [Rhizomicrobium palustre]
MGRRKNKFVLDEQMIVETINRLHARIEARFPGSGLGRVGAELLDLAKHTAKRARKSNRPFVSTKLISITLAAIWAGSMVYLGSFVNWRDVLHRVDIVSLAQALESVVNLSFLIGGAIWFVWTRETAVKRKRVFHALYQLRALAHVIDMHQLTKDPSVELGTYTETSVSPERVLSDFELSRYLDYCSEMLALIAKLAALYASESKDNEILNATNDIENLTTNLGRKIWQKIMIISQLAEANKAGA